jgi:hypothetical protein
MKRTQTEIAKARVDQYLKRPAMEPLIGGMWGALSAMASISVFALLTPTLHEIYTIPFFVAVALGFAVPWGILRYGHNRYAAEVTRVFLALRGDED